MACIATQWKLNNASSLDFPDKLSSEKGQSNPKWHYYHNGQVLLRGITSEEPIYYEFWNDCFMWQYNIHQMQEGDRGFFSKFYGRKI